MFGGNSASVDGLTASSPLTDSRGPQNPPRKWRRSRHRYLARDSFSVVESGAHKGPSCYYNRQHHFAETGEISEQTLVCHFCPTNDDVLEKMVSRGRVNGVN